ncbi:MAG: MBL fold metallo-hydrolase [Cyanobacteria bacterium]|nr:MBL fold metallo-hydrolase [Cyanobacteriota bacterium]MDW8202759.1 MBL fold metallo-hydrolase [Cyanobacteriota bacterium SKYGB_h_bin112]
MDRQANSAPVARPASPNPNDLTIKWLGHTCFLFTSRGLRILVNPFQTIGCTAGYRPPRVQSDLVMVSSRLLDEGFLDMLPGTPRLLVDPGAYQFQGLPIQGISTAHDRIGGRRFGINVAWRWTQAGIAILHLGGIAAPITSEQRILMGRPDVLFLPVGGGPKAYSPSEALQAVNVLNPKLVIPTHFRTRAANAAACDIVPIEEFLALMQGVRIRRAATDQITLRAANLPSQGMEIQLLTYTF